MGQNKSCKKKWRRRNRERRILQKEDKETITHPVKYTTIDTKIYTFVYISTEKSTNPLNCEDDPNSIQAVCQAVSSEAGGVQTAVRLIAHKIQSPQERESLQALAVREGDICSGADVLVMFCQNICIGKKNIILMRLACVNVYCVCMCVCLSACISVW